MMNGVAIGMALIFFTAFVGSLSAEKKECPCPVLECGPCQNKVDQGSRVEFCDWGDMSVCRKEACENISNYYACLSDNSLAPQTGAVSDSQPLVLEYENGDWKGRGLASSPAKNKKGVINTQGLIEVENSSRVIEGPQYSDKVVFQVAKNSSSLELVHRGERLKSFQNRPLYVGDEIFNKSGRTQQITLQFAGGEAQLRLAPKTQLQVEDPHSILGHFQPFLYLLHGGLEIKANINADASLDILAGQIVARMRRGEYQVVYEMGIDGLQVRAENTQGEMDILRAGDLLGEKIPVQAGAFVHWVSETSGALFSKDEKQALVSAGFITPVFLRPTPEPLSPKPAIRPQAPLANPFVRGLASSDGFCSQPTGDFQQCAWSCEGGPKGAKTCPVDGQKVRCVRRICNAAGQWGAPTTFATSYKDLCPNEGVRVGDCNP